MELKIKKMHPDAKMPSRGTKGAACFDLYAVEDTLIGSGTIKEVMTGLAFEVPDGYCLTIYSRSSSFSKRGLIIVPLIVDSDYRGEVKVFARYVETWPTYTIVKRGERIAQFKIERLEPTDLVEADELSVTERGTGGHGSTGA